MTVPLHSPPPIRTAMVDDQGRVSTAWAEWFKVHYMKTGEATTKAPIYSRNITEQLDIGSQVTGELNVVNLVPNAQPTAVSFATVDSIDAGADTTIRVYGAGGVATPWERKIGAVLDGTFPAATLPGYPYGIVREVYYRANDGQFFVFDPVADYASTLDPLLRYVGTTKTVAAGGAGGISGGGGATGGRFGNRLAFDVSAY